MQTSELKRQLSQLSGTGMITLAIPPNSSLSRIKSMLIEEYTRAKDIKKKRERNFIMETITKVQKAFRVE